MPAYLLEDGYRLELNTSHSALGNGSFSLTHEVVDTEKIVYIEKGKDVFYIEMLDGRVRLKFTHNDRGIWVLREFIRKE